MHTHARWLLVVSLLVVPQIANAGAPDKWVVYEGRDGPGMGKHIVLISGDEEYRSEEALPQLGKILAKHHGFKCTCLFAIDPKDGTINPNVKNNIPGLETLKTADLLILFTRMRDLPDDQMEHLVEYIESGRPIVGLRTATHAFQGGKKYAKYSFTVLYNDQFDRFSAPIEKRYDPDEVRELLRAAGLSDVQVRPCFGWIADGIKPTAPDGPRRFASSEPA